MITPYAKNAIVLGLLAAIGPFAIDMYLPALPTIASDLGASTAATQMTLMAFFVSFGACQIVYGPLSDMLGRKPPLYLGLSLFIVGSLGCAAAPSIEWLIFFRVIQGVGGSCAAVIPRAVVRDLHTGIEATRLMATVMLVFSVAPILAPLTGSALIVPFGWRSVFIAVSAVAVAALLLVVLALPETRPPEKRIRVSFSGVVNGFGRLLRHGRFMGLTLIGALGISSFFAFLASSAFVYINHFGLSPTGYSLAFAVNAIGFIGASQFAAVLGGRFGMAAVVRTAALTFMVLAVTLFTLTAVGIDSLPMLIVLLAMTFACLGLVIPSTMVLALEEHGPIAGIASALGGTIQSVIGGAVIALVSVFFDGTTLPMVAAIAALSVATWALASITLAGQR